MDDIFSGHDPIAIIKNWLNEAEVSEPNDPNAIALATVGRDGLPNVRMMLLKGVDARGFTFYTNYKSQKAQELAENPQAAFVIHWKTLRQQVRVRGTVVKQGGPEADAYFASRSIESRLGAWASRQSKPLENRATLERAVDGVRARLGETPPRPEFWGGFRIVPSEIELWCDGKDRLHERASWTRSSAEDAWQVARLYP